jgi:inhibitor of cysteine peptidase
MASLTQTDDGTSIDLSVGETLSIALPENASTGYRWAPERFDPDVLELLPEEERYADAGPGVGSGGTVTLTFRAKQPGASEVALKKWRAWEGDSSVSERFATRIAVAPARES